MPDAATCAHPFHATRWQNAGFPGRVLVAHVALEEERDRRYAGVRGDAEARAACGGCVEIVEEYERLDPLACAGRAHQASYRPVSLATGAVDDGAVLNQHSVHGAAE